MVAAPSSSSPPQPPPGHLSGTASAPHKASTAGTMGSATDADPLQSVILHLLQDVRTCTTRAMQRDSAWCVRQLLETRAQVAESASMCVQNPVQRPRIVERTHARQMDRDVTEVIERHVLRVQEELLGKEVLETPDHQQCGGGRARAEFEVLRPEELQFFGPRSHNEVEVAVGELEKLRNKEGPGASRDSEMLATTHATLTTLFSEDTMGSTAWLHTTGTNASLHTSESLSESKRPPKEKPAVAGLTAGSRLGPTLAEKSLKAAKHQSGSSAVEDREESGHEDEVVDHDGQTRAFSSSSSSPMGRTLKVDRTPRARTPCASISERVQIFQARIDEIQKSSLRLPKKSGSPSPFYKMPAGGGAKIMSGSKNKDRASGLGVSKAEILSIGGAEHGRTAAEAAGGALLSHGERTAAPDDVEMLDARCAGAHSSMRAEGVQQQQRNPTSAQSQDISSLRPLDKFELHRRRKLIRGGKKAEDNYAVSDRESSDSELEGEEERSPDRAGKPIPHWCENWLQQVLAQSKYDPDTIFGEHSDLVPPQLVAIFGSEAVLETVQAKRRKRGSSENWEHDQLTPGEIKRYKNTMGQKEEFALCA